MLLYPFHFSISKKNAFALIINIIKTTIIAAVAAAVMDMSDYPTTKSPRKELLGPRPAPLKVRKDSHKIKKPPVVPAPQQQQLPGPPRQPVIIYTVSPKVIHTNPSEFMNLVQRLTGPSSTSASTSAFGDNSGAVSPAARFASVERTRSPDGKKLPKVSENYDVMMMEGVEISSQFERGVGNFPGILSPNPASLPPIPSNFFSPPSDQNPNSLGFFHDLSPVLHSNRNYLDNSFILPSPSTFVSPRFASPNAPSLDLFNNFFDL